MAIITIPRKLMSSLLLWSKQHQKTLITVASLLLLLLLVAPPIAAALLIPSSMTTTITSQQDAAPSATAAAGSSSSSSSSSCDAIEGTDFWQCVSRTGGGGGSNGEATAGAAAAAAAGRGGRRHVVGNDSSRTTTLVGRPKQQQQQQQQQQRRQQYRNYLDDDDDDADREHAEDSAFAEELRRRQQQWQQQQQRQQAPSPSSPSSLSAAAGGDGGCFDNHEYCEEAARGGKCVTENEFMLKQCRKACRVCGQVEFNNELGGFVVHSCYGEPQTLDHDNSRRMVERLKRMDEYMFETVFADPKYEVVKEECRNYSPNCTFWAVSGECENTPEFMAMECSPACFSCEQLDFRYHCPFDETEPTIWNPGDLNKFFARITSDPQIKQRYKPTVLSSPAKYQKQQQQQQQQNNNKKNNKKKSASKGMQQQEKDGPWVVTLDNFLSPSECQHLIDVGRSQGYDRFLLDDSHETASNVALTPNDPEQVSTMTWCEEDCHEDPTVQDIVTRIEDLTQIPDANAEYLQLLQYENDQYDQFHHDYIAYDKERSQGVRILTLFVFLNNITEGGGGTNFTDLGLTVLPKQGRVLLWPSVLDEDPNAMDQRTKHRAIPVKEGVKKYGANAWIHQRDFKTPYQEGCI